jgi:hypothetical protein
MFRSFRFAVLLTLAAAIPRAAAAQERPTEFDTWTVPGWIFTPSISIGGMWDSNVAVATDQANGRKTDRDRLFVFEPQSQLEFHSNRTEFLAGYKGYLRRHIEISELNGFDQRMYLTFQRLVTKRVTFFARNEWADVPSTDDVDLNGILYERTGSRSNRVTTGVETRLTKYDDVDVQYENTWIEFDNTSLFTRGGFMHAVSADYGRRLSERTTLGAEYRIRHADMNGGDDIIVGDDIVVGDRVMWFHDVGGVIEHALAEHLTLKAAGGYSVVLDPRLDDRHGGAYMRAELARQGERSTAGFYYARSFAPTFGFGGSSESHELRGYLHMPVTRNRMYVQTSGAWRRTDPLAVAEEIDLDSFTADGTVGYAPSRWLRVEGFYIYTRQDSRITGGEINRHRAGVRLVLAQPMRIH